MGLTMKRKARVITLVLHTLLLLICLNQSILAQQVSRIESERFDFSVSLKNGAQAFEDTSGLLTINEVVNSSEFDKGLGDSNDPNGIYWLKVTLFNATPYDMDVIATGPRTIDSQLFKAEGNGFFTARFGSFQQKQSINQGDSRTHVRFKLRSGVAEDIYFCGQGRAFTASFIDLQSFNKGKSFNALQDYLLFGACFILVFFSFIQFLIYQKRMFLWLTIFALGTAMYSFAIRGYFIDWFMPNMPKTGLNFSLLWAQLGHLGGLLLAINFLELKSRFPVWNKVFMALIGLLVFRTSYGLYLTAVHEDYGAMTNMGLYTLLIDIAVFIALLFSIWKKVNISRKVFLSGLVLFGVALIIAILSWKLSFIQDFRLVLLYTGSISSLTQIIIFSIALGLQMRQHEVDKNLALGELNTVLKEQNKNIESEVKERTTEISNQKLMLEERNERIETLFKEVHHRVKNNLQLISSLLNMQREWSSTDDPIKAIEDSRSRVVAMAMIHQFLYRTDDISTIDFRQYAEELTSKLDSIQVQRVSYQLHLDFDKDYVFDIDTSISLGLILNELITNSYKHAILNKKNLNLRIMLESTSMDYYRMTYSDDGKAIDIPFEEAVKKGFGLRLASRLSKQLQGNFDYMYKDGNQFSVTFATEETRNALADD